MIFIHSIFLVSHLDLIKSPYILSFS
uniref:Uncharacterized protein n=1 Tax=Arundo donax TaxID=35708 RepID=A0A0A9C0X5_ARUDO